MTNASNKLPRSFQASGGREGEAPAEPKPGVSGVGSAGASPSRSRLALTRVASAMAKASAATRNPAATRAPNTVEDQSASRDITQSMAAKVTQSPHRTSPGPLSSDARFT